MTFRLATLLLGFFALFPNLVLTSSSFAQSLKIENVIIAPRPFVAAGQEMSFSVKLSQGVVASSFEWNFGDSFENPELAPGSAEMRHVFKEPGNYVVRLRVKNAAGDFDTKVLRVLAYDPSINSASLKGLNNHSSSIVVDQRERKVWVVNPDNDSISSIDADTLSLASEVRVGKKPTSLALDRSGRLWVTCRDDDSIHVIEGRSGRSLGSVRLRWGFGPVGVVAHVNSDKISFVGEMMRVIATLNTTTLKISAARLLDGAPRALALSPNEREVLVTQFLSSDSAGVVYTLDAKDLSIKRAIPLVADATSLDTTNGARGVPNYLLDVVFHPAGGRAWITGKKDNIFAGALRDPSSPLNPETTLRSFVTTIDVANRSEVIAQRIDINDRGLAGAAVFSPLGTVAFVALPTNNSVVFLDTKNGGTLQELDTGAAPEGLALDLKTGRLFVQEFLGRSITVVRVANFLIQGGGGASVERRIATVTQEKLSGDVLSGKKIFYNAADRRMALAGYISCASCHLDGGHDGRTWDFTQRGEGLRNNTSLRGGRGDLNGKVHWTGNFDEIQDFEHDIRNAFGGTGFIPLATFDDPSRNVNSPLGNPKQGISPELDALASYVRSLNRFDRSPYRAVNGRYTNVGAAGARLFFALKCNDCHSGPLLTDSASGVRHSMPTIVPSSGKRLDGPLDGLDTPTLIGLSGTAPYFHNGSAATLEAVFGAAGKGAPHDLSAKVLPVHTKLLALFLLQLDSADGDANSNGKSDLMELAAIGPRFDADRDGLDDVDEIISFGNLSQSGSGDFDGDGASNSEELIAGSNPVDPASKPQAGATSGSRSQSRRLGASRGVLDIRSMSQMLREARWKLKGDLLRSIPKRLQRKLRTSRARGRIR